MIPTSFTTISDLRFKTKAVFAKAAKSPVLVLHQATPKGVIMSVSDYEDMMSTLEDYYLSFKAEEYEKEDKSKVDWITIGELKKQFKLE